MAHVLDDLRVKFTLSEGTWVQWLGSGLQMKLNVILMVGAVKSLTKQLLEGVEYIHRNNIIHRYTFYAAFFPIIANSSPTEI